MCSLNTQNSQALGLSLCLSVSLLQTQPPTLKQSGLLWPQGFKMTNKKINTNYLAIPLFRYCLL